MTPETAKMHFHAMIFFTYNTPFKYLVNKKPVQSEYKRALKVLDNKPKIYHHCNIVPKYGLLCWKNLIHFHNVCLMYKMLNGLAPPPINTFISQKNVLFQVESWARNYEKNDQITSKQLFISS